MITRRKTRKSIDPMGAAMNFARVVMGGLYAYAGVLVAAPEIVNVSNGNLFLALYSGGCATFLVYADHSARRSMSDSALYRSNRSWKELTQ